METKGSLENEATSCTATQDAASNEKRAAAKEGKVQFFMQLNQRNVEKYGMFGERTQLELAKRRIGIREVYRIYGLPSFPQQGTGISPFPEDHGASIRIWVDERGISRFQIDGPSGAKGDVIDFIKTLESFRHRSNAIVQLLRLDRHFAGAAPIRIPALWSRVSKQRVARANANKKEVTHVRG